jgi:hypothetical protein
MVQSIERLYCKRPILCLASSKILTPTPLTARRVCSTPRLWCWGRTHSLGGEGGGGPIFWKTADTALYSTCVCTLWVQSNTYGNKQRRHSILSVTIVTPCFRWLGLLQEDEKIRGERPRILFSRSRLY